MPPAHVIRNSRLSVPGAASLHSPALTACSPRVRGAHLLLFVAGLLFAGCKGPGSRNREAVAALSELPPAPYVRILHSGSNQVELQIAAREFLPAHRGQPAVWLTGVSHIGESNYYAKLQAHLDAQTLVLFEGVGAAESQQRAQNDNQSGPPAAPATNRPVHTAESSASLQYTMAESLGLVFQLDAIDYQRTNFQNCDLSITQLRELIAQQETATGSAGVSESFEGLLGLMGGGSWMDSLLQTALRLLGTNPKFQALGRLALIDLLGQIQGDPTRLQGLPPELKQLLDVLLQKRNQNVIATLKQERAEVGGHGSISVFYGTGHMPDLEERLRRELRYRPAREIWFTAFSVDLEDAKVTASERAFVDNFVMWQVKEASRTRAN